MNLAYTVTLGGSHVPVQPVRHLYPEPGAQIDETNLEYVLQEDSTHRIALAGTWHREQFVKALAGDEREIEAT